MNNELALIHQLFFLFFLLPLLGFSCTHWNDYLLVEITMKKNKISISEEIADRELEVMNTLLSELYHTLGNNHQEKKQPKIKIGETNIAQYTLSTNTIIVGEDLIQFAISQSSKDKTNLYLHILGHELGHYYIRVFGKLPTTKNSNGCHRKESDEKTADFYSVFMAMLAGYIPIKNEVENIVENLYTQFDLKLSCYPPKKERQQAATLAIEKADSLYQLFQFANYLTALEEYQSAIEIYDYLLRFYGGAEFYNNRAILHTLQGLKENYGNNAKYKRYFFPIELDLESKLLNVRTDSEELSNIKKEHFKSALLDFDSAIALNQQKETYHLNKVSALILLEEYDSARRLLKESCGDSDVKKLLEALIMAAEKKETLAKQTLLQLSEGNKPVNQLAKLNLKVININYQPPVPIRCSTELTPRTIGGRRFATASSFLIKENSNHQYGWADWDNIGRCFFLREKGKLFLNTQQLTDELSFSCFPNYLGTAIGLNFLIFTVGSGNNEKKIVVIRDKKGREKVVVVGYH